jgi:hypothetical protein
MIRALTWMDSGRPRGVFPVSNMDNLLAMDPERSRKVFLPVSGDESRESGGDGVVPLRAAEARSSTDGDFAGSTRGLVLRTEKKVEDGRSLGTTSPLPPAPAVEESFSSALMR